MDVLSSKKPPILKSTIIISNRMRTEPQPIYSEIGKKICQIRKKINITQTDLAKKIGTRQQLIASFENGRRRISLSLFLKISEALYVDIYDLLPMDSYRKKPGPSPKIKQGYDQILQLSEEDQQIILNMVNSLYSKEK